MKRPLIAFLSIVILLFAVGCRKRVTSPVPQGDVSNATSGTTATSPKAGVSAIAWTEPAITTENYRRAFNETAGTLFDLRWVRDGGELGDIDLEANEIVIPSAQRERFDQPEHGALRRSATLDRAIELVRERLEQKRRAAIDAALAEELEAFTRFDLSQLDEPNQKAVRALVEVGFLIDDLYKLQNHPLSLEFERTLIEEGDLPSIRFFKRVGGPTSFRTGAFPFANAMPFFPDPMIGMIMWPEGMDASLFAQLASDPMNGLMSPFTVVKRSEAGALMAIPYGGYPPFARILRPIVRRLEEIALIPGMDPSLAHQLALQAKALAAPGSDDPFIDSDQAWIDARAPLEVIIGPYETDRDPYATKAFYEFILGVRNDKLQALADGLKGLRLEVETTLSNNLSGGAYAARPIVADPPMAIIDVVLATGFSAGDEGPHLATMLPNVGKAAKEGRQKRVIMANHHRAKLPLLKQIAEIALDPKELARIDERAFVLLSTLKALLFGVGPQATMPADDKVDATRTRTLAAAQRDVMAAWTAFHLEQKGILTRSGRERFYATWIANLFRNLRFGPDHPVARAARLELAALAWHGALKERGNRFAINSERMQPVLERLLAGIVRAIATGNADAAVELTVTYPGRAPEGLGIVAERIEAARMPRDVALVYTIQGL